MGEILDSDDVRRSTDNNCNIVILYSGYGFVTFETEEEARRLQVQYFIVFHGNLKTTLFSSF